MEFAVCSGEGSGGGGRGKKNINRISSRRNESMHRSWEGVEVLSLLCDAESELRKRKGASLGKHSRLQYTNRDNTRKIYPVRVT